MVDARRESSNLPALLIVLLITYVLYIGISESARLNSIIVGIKLFVIAAVIVVGAFFVQAGELESVRADGMGGRDAAAPAVIFFAYIGFDAVSTAAEEVVDPNRDLPLGILGSLFVCTAALHPGRRRADRDGAGARDRHDRAARVGIPAARDARHCRD